MRCTDRQIWEFATSDISSKQNKFNLEMFNQILKIPIILSVVSETVEYF